MTDLSNDAMRTARGQLLAVGRLLVSAPAYPALLLLFVISALLQPAALSLPFLYLVLRQAAPLGVLALGQRFPIVGRTLDLSVGGQIALVNVMLAVPSIASGPTWINITVPLLIGIVAGAVNGIIIVRLRASSVIVTLGTSILLLGASLLISGGAPGGDINEFVRWLGRGRISGFPVAPLVWFAAAILMAMVVRHTVFFRTLEAAGSNYTGARLAGLPVGASLVMAHIMAGIFAAISGILLTGYIGTGTVDLGSDLVLASVAAVILGGSTFGLNRGGFFGCVAGVLVLIYLGNLLTTLGFPEPFKLVVQGLVVISAAALAVRRD